MSENADIITAEEAEETALAVDASFGMLGAIVSDVRDLGFYTTFDTDSMSGRKRLYKATNASVLLRDYMETPIEVEHIAFAPTSVTDDDGEAKTVMGVFIIDVDGNSYVSSSSGVIKSAAQIIEQLGKPDTWDEPVKVVCKETNTAKGRRYKFLDVE